MFKGNPFLINLSCLLIIIFASSCDEHITTLENRRMPSIQLTSTQSRFSTSIVTKPPGKPTNTSASHPTLIPVDTSFPAIDIPSPPPTIKINPENADRIKPLACWGACSINQVVFSSSGGFLAAATSMGYMLLDTQRLSSDGARAHDLARYHWELSVRTLSISPDESLLAGASLDAVVRLWHASDGSDYLSLIGHSDRVNTVAFSPDGKILASGSDDSTIRLWQVADGALLRTLKGHTAKVSSIAFSPDGKSLVSGSDDKTILFWNVANGALIRTLLGVNSSISSLAFSPDGNILASGSDDALIHLWSSSTGTLLRILSGHVYGVTSVAFSPNGTVLASGSWDWTVRTWRVSDGVPLDIFQEHTANVSSVDFSPDGKFLASGSWDLSVKLRQLSDGAILHSFEGLSGNITSAVVSPNGEIIASGFAGLVKLWNVEDGSPLRSFELSGEAVTFSPDTSMVFTGRRIFWIGDGTLLRMLYPNAYSSSSSFSPDGKQLATSDQVKFGVYRIPDGSFLWGKDGVYNGEGLLVSYSPNGAVLASGSSMKGEVSFWRADNGVFLRKLEWKTDSIHYPTPGGNRIAFSPDWSILATVSDESIIRLWRISDGELLFTLEENVGLVQSLSFSPDGAILASGGSDGTIKLWNTTNGTLLKTLIAGRSDINCISFSPSGSFFISGSWHGELRIWGVME